VTAEAVAFQGLCHFSAVTVVGGYEGGTDQQENQVGRGKVIIDLTVNIGAELDLSVAPNRQESLSDQEN
jgi:hypothetical protein